jgi:hypothetical protein
MQQPVAQMFDVMRDLEGVREASLALLEESFIRSLVSSSYATGTDEAQARMESAVPPREMSPGYYRCADYLMWLEERSTVAHLELLAFESDGLVQLKYARNEFGFRHPSCGGCGTRQEQRFSTSCRGCGMKFQRRDS